MRETQEKTRHVLVVRLPRAVEIRIEDVFLGLAGATKPTMGYHITVLGPFFLADGIDPRSLTPVSQVCARWRPFEVYISGLSAFQTKDDNTVYLRVQDCNRIVDLHYDLLRATRGLINMQDERILRWNEEQYEPHVTLALNLVDKGLAEFMRAAATRDLQASFTVDKIWLCLQEPNGPWQYTAQFPFGETGPEPSSDE
ncbi:MAG: 2'-5' RNA ligase family protein [Chloroflexi bacterium]|nr:2'-5' RNA ligase family protein [Chloroflexota bacterium]